MPRWGGHGLSWPPDSGIGLSTDGRAKAVDWAGLTRVHSGRPSHNRPDESEGLQVE